MRTWLVLALAAMLVAPALAEAALPSGRTGTYRRLADYQNEMKALTAANPSLVKALQLPHATYEGRTVEGLEITTDAGARDGKPVFLLTGLHHGRDWPSGEHAIEWAYELINGYNAGDPRVRALVASTRTIVIPVVNPDGFNISREAGQAEGAAGGRGGGEPANIVAHPLEYRRKNCRLPTGAPAGDCATSSGGVSEPGVNLDRNHAAFWGGPGASTDPTNVLYRGPGPASEPEVRNLRALISGRQVTTMVSNHANAARLTRPPGLQALGEPPDEPVYAPLAAAMAAENGYMEDNRHEFHGSTGTVEDWAYYATGALSFSFEIGCNPLDRPARRCNSGNFHPPYAEMIAEYDGSSATSGPGGGNREAYFKALESTADASRHSVLDGRAPAGAVLRLRKSFQTPSFPQADGNPILSPDALNTTSVVPGSGSFEWHVNPSTRPLVAQSRGRPATGSPSGELPFSGATTGPGDGATACGDSDSTAGTCVNDHPFIVPQGSGLDNAAVRVRVAWENLTSDWDLRVFHDAGGDGAVGAGDVEVARSIQSFTDFEETILAEPALVPGQRYVARLVNFAATEPYDGTITFSGPDPPQPASTESWTLSCELPEGTVRLERQVTIARGQRQSLDLGGCAPASSGAGPGPGSGAGPSAGADLAPRVLSAALRPGRFRALGSGPSIRAAAARGSRLTYSLSEPARTRFRVERARAGRRVGRRCVAPTARNRSRRRCTRYVLLRGSFTHSGKAGVNRLRFSGRLRGRRLAPGTHRLVLVATDAGGKRSTPRRTGFRIVRR